MSEIVREEDREFDLGRRNSPECSGGRAAIQFALQEHGPSYMKHGDGLLARYKNTATTVTKRIPKKKLTKRRSENQNAKQNTCRYHSNKHCKNFEDKLFVISAPSPSPANHHYLALLKAPKRRKNEVQLVDRGVSQHNHTWRRSKWQPIDRGGVVCK